MHWYSRSSKNSLGHNQIGVYDDVKQIFKTVPTPRKTKVTSRLFSTPRSAFFPQYFESCDFRQRGISDVNKNGVRWTFAHSLELKRPKTRVFLLNSLPDKVQKNLKKEGECQILILGKHFFEICLLMVECLVLCKLFLHSAVLLKMQQWVAS